jgi:hypothetical protein
MTPIIHFNGPSSETEPVPLCRRRPMECQRTALTTTDPKVRLRYLHLAKLWREMADDAERRTNGSTPSEAHGVVIFLGEFRKSK